MSLRALAGLLATLAIACGSQHVRGGGHDAKPADAATTHDGHDAPPADASHTAGDAAPTGDAGAHDAASMADATPTDAHTTPADAALSDAARPDAAPADATPADAPPADASGGATDAGTGSVTVACYAEASPNATCTSPDHCCFSNYNSYHDGVCSTSSCNWGTIDCDGPEDCAAGQHCCSHATYDPALGVTGYLLACQSAACGSPPFDQELCHTSATCPSGTTCVSAYGNDNDLPRVLSICQ